MREMTDIELRAAEVASVSVQAFGVKPIPGGALAAAHRVLEFHARGRLHLPSTLQWARRTIDKAN